MLLMHFWKYLAFTNQLVSMVAFISGRNLPDKSSFILAFYNLFLIEKTWEKQFLVLGHLLN